MFIRNNRLSYNYDIFQTRLLSAFSYSYICSTANAGSLRIPIEGQLIYDSSSKTADLCLSPLMCPTCVFDVLCNQGGINSMQGTNNPPYSTNALPLTTVSTTPTSSSTEAASTESPSTTEATTQSVPTTEEPASSTTASIPSSSSITDHTPSSASETTLLTEATEATDGGNLNPTTSVTVSAATVGGGIDAEAGNYGDFIGKKI